MAKNVFEYNVLLERIDIPNAPQDVFREKLFEIPYLLYEVESLNDGNKIVINKPGGKRNWGRLSRNDFMVFIYYVQENKLWLISHHEILEDLQEKYSVSIRDTEKIITALYQVCCGNEPDCVLKKLPQYNLPGIPIDALLKVYKWIWGQEDCNYPNQQGRWLSMNEILYHFDIKI